MTTAITSLKKYFIKSNEPDDTFGFPRQPAAITDGLVDIVIPVYNEAHSLPASIATLEQYLSQHFPYRYQVTIADNGSIDATWIVAQSLAAQYTHVSAVHIEQKGRGRALKQVWSQSTADVLAYMDVDLSTDLSAFEPLVTPLFNGSAVVATGSRLQKQSKVQRSLKREIISRSYNYILRATLPFKTSDAQCGFKAIRADVARKLIPQIADDDWFFDTELLAKAQHAGHTIHEVAVSWREDPDSRVNIVKTARDDLKGMHRVRKELRSKPTWETWAILGIVAATALLYGIGASQNGYGNSFYAAAVQAGTHSWKAFFFGSLDAGNYITVDKPPVALWFMEISTRIFGFHSWSMLLPEVLAGAATVYLVYASVRRWFSAHSALLAASVMALTPVAVLMFGFNNPDAVLTLLLTASVYTTIRALDSSKPIRWLALTALMTGLAFNTKMLQGFIVLPVLGLVYLLAAKPSLVQRLKHLLLASIFLAIATLWWPVAVSLTPASSRPYIGSSTNNSVWDLILGYNGFGRLLGNSQGGGGMGGSRPTGTAPAKFGGTTGFTPPTGMIGRPTGGMGGRGGGPGGSGFGGSTGVLRMFNSDFGPNIGWFLPIAFGSTVLALWQRRRRPRIDKQRAAFLLWGGYLGLHVAVFSMTSGTIHPYYPVAMAPAVAALVGMGVPVLLRAYRQGGRAAFFLPVLVAATAITGCILLGYQSTWLPWLRWVVLVGGMVSAIGLLTHLLEPLQRLVKPLLLLAAISCTLAPTAYALDTATVTHTGSIPSAGPTGTGMQGSNNESAAAESALVSYLEAHQGSAKWIVAVASANQSAAIQISTGQPVMAVGGFNGGDNAITTTQLAALVASGQLKYYAVSSGGGMGGGGMGNNAIQSYVTAHGTKVSYGGTGYTLYDLRP